MNSDIKFAIRPDSNAPESQGAPVFIKPYLRISHDSVPVPILDSTKNSK